MKLSLFVVVMQILAVGVYASTSKEIFAKFKNRYFVETGSYCGDGIQSALDAGFEEVYSIELSLHHYEQCLQRFTNKDNIHLIFGDSSIQLARVLELIDKPATFWLDGHYSGGTTARGNSDTPILAELAAIGQHPIKTHTILIDDVRLFGSVHFDYIDFSSIVAELHKINPNYDISFVNGFEENDVLVARLL